MTSTYGSAQIPTQLKVIRIIMHALGTISPSLAGYLALRLFSSPQLSYRAKSLLLNNLD